ncbi:MAG: hypothetical protein CMI07_06055 [Oceanospirillaceae bacterium]|nr:hypothetical protein [Oceanospirillaceae bacterium]
MADDDGGHIVGHRFMSDQGEKNLFPQKSNLNRGAYKSKKQFILTEAKGQIISLLEKQSM